MECIYMYMGASIDTAENTELVASLVLRPSTQAPSTQAPSKIRER